MNLNLGPGGSHNVHLNSGGSGAGSGSVSAPHSLRVSTGSFSAGHTHAGFLAAAAAAAGARTSGAAVTPTNSSGSGSGPPPALPARPAAASIAALRSGRLATPSAGAAEDAAARARVFAAAATVGHRLSLVRDGVDSADDNSPSSNGAGVPGGSPPPPPPPPPASISAQSPPSLSAQPRSSFSASAAAVAAAAAASTEQADMLTGIARYPCGDVVWFGELITAPLSPHAVAGMIATAAGEGGDGTNVSPTATSSGSGGSNSGAGSTVTVSSPSAASAAAAAAVAPYGVGSFPASILEPVQFDEAVPLAYLLHVPQARDAFIEHLRREYSVENYEFWCEARAFRLRAWASSTASSVHSASASSPLTDFASDAAAAEAMYADAEALCARFVRNDAPQQVNLRGDVQTAVLRAMSDSKGAPATLSPAVFVAAEDEIYRLLSQDSLSRFKKTSAFATLLKQAKLGR